MQKVKNEKMDIQNELCIVMNQNIIINVFTWIIYKHTYICICYSLTMNLLKILYEVYVLLYSYKCKIYKRGLLSSFKIETST